MTYGMAWEEIGNGNWEINTCSMLSVQVPPIVPRRTYYCGVREAFRDLWDLPIRTEYLASQSTGYYFNTSFLHTLFSILRIGGLRTCLHCLWTFFQ